MQSNCYGPYKCTEVMTHVLKTDKEIFQANRDWKCNCNLRKNDRGFKVGDLLILRETKFSGMEMLHGAPLEYTGRSMTVKVTHVMYGPFYGLPAGWCIVSFLEWDTLDDAVKTYPGDCLL